MGRSVLTELIVITLQLNISNRYVILLEVLQCYMSVTSHDNKGVHHLFPKDN